MSISVKKSVKKRKSNLQGLRKHTFWSGESHTDRVNVIVLFLLIGVIIVMVVSVIFNLVVFGNGMVVPRMPNTQESLLSSSGSADGVVTLQIIEPRREEKNRGTEDEVPESVDS